MISKEEFHSFCEAKSIAIVGNSKALLEHNFGQDIDAHDIVLRFNAGYPEPKFQQYVGTRTDIWACASYSGMKSIHKFQGNFTYALWANWHTRSLRESIKPQTFILPIQYWYYVRRLMGANPTSGAVVLTYFNEHIDYRSMTVYGFDFLKTSNFFRTPVWRRPPDHNPEREEAYLRPLLEEGRGIAWIKT
jgi:hypothetical protein